MLPCGTINKSYAEDMAIFRTRLQWIMLIAFLSLLLTLPLYGNEQLLALANAMAIVIIAVLGLNILTGYCGQISVGQAAFMGVGAFTSAILSVHLGWSFWVTLPCATLSAGLVGLIFGLPALRVKGFYLAMTTLAAQFMITYAILHGGKLTGGYVGLTVAPPKLANIVFDTETEFFYLIIGITMLMVFFATNISRTKIGRALVAIRDNDLAAEMLGINLNSYKLLAFFICCLFAGVAGSLQVYYLGIANTDFYSMMDSIWMLGMLIVGGMGSIMGAILGTAFIMLVNEATVIIAPIFSSIFPIFTAAAFAALGMGAKGLVIALFLIYEPRGINHRWEIFKSSYRLFPFSN